MPFSLLNDASCESETNKVFVSTSLEDVSGTCHVSMLGVDLSCAPQKSAVGTGVAWPQNPQ